MIILIKALTTLFLCAASCIALAQDGSASVGQDAQDAQEKSVPFVGDGEPAEQEKSVATGGNGEHAEVAQQKVMERVRDLVAAGKAADAIPLLDTMLDHYAKQYPEGDTRWYVARTPEETLAYMVEAASAFDRGTATGSKAVSLYVLWSEAYYMKGYALVELGLFAKAKPPLERAIQLSPYNARYLAELGNLYQEERNWEKAYELYSAAEDGSAFSLPSERIKDLGRAKRGLAFVLIEQGKFDEARKQLKECLKLDRNDQRAKEELDYIRKLEAAKSTTAA